MEKSRFFQGLWSFSDFEHYLNNWIKPNILGDLSTIFTGTAEKYVSDGEPKNGRGDFMLTTLLFSVFDHLGNFLAETPEVKAITTKNISRIAQRIPSIRKVDMILAYFGRHALVHSAWPDTMVFVEEKKAFGLNIWAYPDIGKDKELKGQHMVLYSKIYPFENVDSDEFYTGIKLRINPYNLLNELRTEIIEGKLFEDIKPEVFLHLKEATIENQRKRIDIGDFEKTIKNKSRKHKNSLGYRNYKNLLKTQIFEQIEQLSKIKT